MSSQLHLLKSNAVVIQSSDDEREPYYRVLVIGKELGCRISIRATKPFPSRLHLHPLHPDWKSLKPKPAEWISIGHTIDCDCAKFSRKHADLFTAWQEIHLSLRRKNTDNASYAFYPEFEYEVGEALAHASLVANLAVGNAIPKCYNSLIKKYGAKNLKRELLRRKLSQKGEVMDSYFEDSDVEHVELDTALWDLGI